ncbi:unnamed protein product [Closterium sp. NIES-54]
MGGGVPTSLCFLLPQCPEPPRTRPWRPRQCPCLTRACTRCSCPCDTQRLPLEQQPPLLHSVQPPLPHPAPALAAAAPDLPAPTLCSRSAALSPPTPSSFVSLQPWGGGYGGGGCWSVGLRGDFVIHPELALPFLTGLVTSCSPHFAYGGFHTCQVAPPCSCRLLSHQTLLWHHRLGHPSLPRLRGMHSLLLVSGLPRSLPPLSPSPAPPCLPCVEGRQRVAPHSSSFPPTSAPLQTLHMDVKGQVVDVLIPWIRTVCLQLRERFCTDLHVLRLHSDRGCEFSFDLLQDFCCGEGILQSFTLPDSPQQNVVDERRIGLVMEVARTSMIHAAAPHFLLPFAVRYAAHQLNLWPRVSLPETSPTLSWTRKVGDASVFRVWGSRAFVRDTSADKLSARAIPCVFLGFSPGWQLYHPTSHCVFPSQDVTFDESVPFFRRFPFRSAPPPPPPLFLAQGPPPLSTQVLLEVLHLGGVKLGGADFEVVGCGGAEPGGAEPGGAELEGVEPGGAESRGVEPRGTDSSGGPAGASPLLSPLPEPLSPQQLREWFAQRTCLRSGATGVGDFATGDTGGGGAGVTAGAGGTGGAAAAGPKGTRTRGTGAAGTDGVVGAGVGDFTELGGAGAGGAGAVGAGAGGTGAGGTGSKGAGAIDPVAGGAGAGGDVSGSTGAGGNLRSQPYFVPLL